ncbi:MAG: T9SS C-terminal target domain-containing protein, partial [Chitinophagia bacterium]|nr:T9SS C-terminal target domain-containing protein [Chitinophagia bacterium]
EAGIYYTDATNSNNKLYIENENGVFTDSILHVVSSSEFRVFEGAGGVFYANISTQTGIEIYKLPGTLPCQNCCGRDTIVIHDTVVSLSHHAGKPGIPTQPLPNPSKDEVKITFTLPNGVSRGELLLYTSSGQLLKSYQVDNRFGFIMLDNTLLAPGLYYYNIVANGQVSSTQKLLVVK